MHFHMNFQVKQNGTELPLNMRYIRVYVLKSLNFHLNMCFIYWTLFVAQKNNF